MPNFSRASKSALASCHEDLKTVANVAIRFYDFKVLEGHRTKERQEELKNAEPPKTFLSWPNSKHNESPSEAFDAAPYPVDWSNHKRFYFLAGVILMTAWGLKRLGIISHELRWGGDWDRDHDFTDQEFHDLGHFELVEAG